MVSSEWKADPERMLCMLQDLLRKNSCRKLVREWEKLNRKGKEDKEGVSLHQVLLEMVFSVSLRDLWNMLHLRVDPNTRGGSGVFIILYPGHWPGRSQELPGVCRSGWGSSRGWGQSIKEKQARAMVWAMNGHREIKQRQDQDKAPSAHYSRPGGILHRLTGASLWPIL